MLLFGRRIAIKVANENAVGSQLTTLLTILLISLVSIVFIK